MKIIIAPDPELRAVCDPVAPDDASVSRLARQMARAMYKNGGCGLAAPQVGVSKRLVVFDCDVQSDEEHPVAIVNPVVTEHSDEVYVGDEGCLSIPGVTLQVPRWTSVRVEALNLEGNEMVFEAEQDLLCRCLQHEIDHLDGITMFERLDPVARIEALQQYQHALEMGAKPGDMEVRG